MENHVSHVQLVIQCFRKDVTTEVKEMANVHVLEDMVEKHVLYVQKHSLDSNATNVFVDGQVLIVIAATQDILEHPVTNVMSDGLNNPMNRVFYAIYANQEDMVAIVNCVQNVLHTIHWLYVKTMFITMQTCMIHKNVPLVPIYVIIDTIAQVSIVRDNVYLETLPMVVFVKPPMTVK
jgi:hypothetical protein